MSEITLRYAEKHDIEFVIEAIIESLKSGTDTIVYCKLFEITIDEFKELLRNILVEDIDCHDLYLGSFLIAEINGIRAGTCASWVEYASGISSSIIRANLLIEFIGPEKLKETTHKFNLMRGTHIDRQKNTLQIEFVYVDPEFRGLGVAQAIIEGHIDRLKQQFPEINKAQVVGSKTNENALKAYTKMGFELALEQEVLDEEAIKLIPSNKIVLLEKSI